MASLDPVDLDLDPAVAAPSVAATLDATSPEATSLGTDEHRIDADDEAPHRSRHRLLGSLRRGKGLVGVILVGLVILLGVLGPFLMHYSPTQQIPGANLVGPSAQHWLGTDQVNRDVLSRTVNGIRTDLLIVFTCVPLGALLGTLVGLLASWWNWSDLLVQRLFDLLLAFPALILAILIAAILGPGLLSVGIVIVAAELPGFGRLIRTSVRSLRESAFVEAARVAGATPGWLLRRHILPNALEPLIVQLAVSMSLGVFVEGSMSFLGLGVRPPQPTLGSMISDGVRMIYDAPYLAVGPLVIVVVLVLGFLLISQALSEAHRD